LFVFKPWVRSALCCLDARAMASALEMNNLMDASGELGDGIAEAGPDHDRRPPAPTSRSSLIRRSAAALVAGSALMLFGVSASIRGGAVARGGSGAQSFRAGGIVEESEFASEPCLCVFDIDRTLTGKQGWAGKCPDDLEKPGVQDVAYAQGTLLLSKLAQQINSTFCKACYRGIVTAGQASGEHSKERAEILKALGGVAYTRSDWWQDIGFNPKTHIRSSLVVQASDGSKQDSVVSMLAWWKADQKLTIDRERVHFFDDIATNVQAFKGTGINARQVSCKVRGPKENMPGQFPGKIGGCGGEPDEVVEDEGIHICG